MRTVLFIDNQWQPAASGRTFLVENPATEEDLARVAEGDATDIDRAVNAARRCFDSGQWSGLAPRKRGNVLARLAELVHARTDELALLESRENGKPLFEAKIDVGATVETLRYYSGWADKVGGDVLPSADDSLLYTLREPVGVVGAIVPWNFPLSLAAWKIAPALAAGCTLVLKPAEETPLTALVLAELAAEANLPAGVLNVVPGYGETAGAALVRHPGVDKISFTGSTEVGRLVAQNAAATNKQVSLELGGKSPNIIFADADLDAAVRGALSGIFYGKGEVCAAGSRLLVERSVQAQVVEGMIAGARKRTAGNPLDKATRLGALVSKKQQQRVLNYIDVGLREGARLVAGGKAAHVEGKGHFVEATVFDGVDPEMTIAKEEIFGPVVAILPFEGAEQAQILANQNPYGLAAGIWTRDISKAHRLARGIRAGTVWINTYGAYDPVAPFGGFKSSGYGRELGRAGIEAFLTTKTIWVNLS
jgi:acyl-CoA reductase-like NAD-dependent aldehyde dehydrogenase